jgi:hypothetical protein
VNLPQAFNEKMPGVESAEPAKRRARGFVVPVVWGLAAVAMVGGAVLILDMTQGASRRPPEAPVRFVADEKTKPAGGAADLRRLADDVAQIKADREKLVARLEILERQIGAAGIASSLPKIGDPAITGSIDHSGGATPEPQAAMSESGGFDSRDGPVRRIEFGIDLGSAPSIDRLKDRWVAMRDLYGATLDKLEPKAVFGRTRDGAVELRLLAGPFPNAEGAVKACASLQTEKTTCEPRPFEGESLPKS